MSDPEITLFTVHFFGHPICYTDYSKEKEDKIMKFNVERCYFGLFYVEYKEDGVLCSDSWTEATLLDEIRKGEVEIISIQPQLLMEDL